MTELVALGAAVGFGCEAILEPGEKRWKQGAFERVVEEGQYPQIP